MKKPAARFLFLVFISFIVSDRSAAQNPATDGHWVTAWGSSVLVPIQFPGMAPEPPISDKTVRMIVRPTIGGQRLRVRLSNEFGTSSLVIGGRLTLHLRTKPQE